MNIKWLVYITYKVKKKNILKRKNRFPQGSFGFIS